MKMASKLRNLSRLLLSFLLVLSLTTSVFYTPVFIPLPRAEAAGVPVWDIPAWVKKAINAIGMIIAQRMIDDMVRASITWANNGFDGNPAFITDSTGFAKSVADQAAGDVINSQEINDLSGPFKAEVRRSILLNYKKVYLHSSNLKGTLSQAAAKVETYGKDFNAGGGWNTWFEVTQGESNNPYDAYLTGTEEVDRQIANALKAVRDDAIVNGGFKNVQECADRNPPVDLGHGSFDGRYKTGECIRWTTKTPGSIIKSQLDKTLGSGLSKLVTANSLDQLVTAFSGALLQRYVFNSKKGLFGDSSAKAETKEALDIDGDKLPDGLDYSGDGQLDICHHGTKDPSKPASNDNCIGSKGVTSSPFFAKLCESIGGTSQGLDVYMRFLLANQKWDPTFSRTWMNRTINAQNAVETFISELSKYNAPQFDPVVNNFGQYSKHLDAMVGSLAAGGDIRNGGLPSDDNITIQITTKGTEERIVYLKTFTAAIGKCDNPNTTAVGTIPLPPPIETSSTTPTDNNGGLQ